MAAKGLTRNITRNEALSYDRTVPNKRGVTALAEINGPGAYERRYRQTRELLENPENLMAYTAGQRLFRCRELGTVQKARANKKKASTPKQRRASRKAAAPKKSYRKNQFPGEQSFAKPKRLLKSDYVAMMMDRGHTKKSAENYWARRGVKPGQKPKKRKGRTYGGGRIKPLKARIGPKSRYTYEYKTKKGRVRHIPDWALLGYKSAAELRKVERSGSEAQRGRLSRKRQGILDRRVRDSGRTRDRIMAGRGTFAPNEGETVLSFEEWKKMRKNAAKKKTRTRKKPRTAAQKAATKRMLAGLKKSRAAKKGRKSAPKRRRATAKRKTTSKRTTRRKTTRRKTTRRKSTGWTKAKRVAAGIRAAATRRRNLRAKGKPVRKTTRKRRSRSITVGRTGHKVRISYAANKRRYRKNVSGEAWKMEMMKALKLGLIVTGGYMAHRAFSKLLDEYVLSKAEFLTKGTVGKYRGLISSAIVAAVGVPVVVRAMPREAGAAGAGIAASFIHGAIITALEAGGEDTAKAAAYLSAYPNAEGNPQYGGVGSYYEFSPHQIYPSTAPPASSVGEFYELPQAGMGEFYETPQAGFGQDLRLNQVTQAAAGYGQSPLLTQAAAGMEQGDLRLNQLTQAAAGMGQNGGALLTQAAAGTGEYVAYGVHGVGEYDEVGTRVTPMTVDEGIYPNLHSAEQAMSVAEAAAGVGSIDVPLQSTVNPMTMAEPIPDVPGGSRAGVFQGGDGIFG